MIVNCAPAEGCVWPDTGRQGRGCARGDERRGESSFLLRRWAYGSRLPCASAGGLRSITPVMRFCWNVLRLVHACHTFLLECFAFDHACLFSFVRKRETACGILRFYSARVGIAISAFSNVVRLSNFVGSLLDCPFLYGDPDGVREDAENGVGDAAWGRFCVNLLALSCFPRGERWGCAPQTAPKSLRLSGLSSWGSRQSTFLRKPISFAMFSAGNTLGLRAPDCAKESLTLWTLFLGFAAEYLLPNLAIIAIFESTHPGPAALGYTERPARVQFMLGRVGLYSDVTYSLQRPDSKRPQALKSRVACAKRSACRLSLPAGRCA